MGFKSAVKHVVPSAAWDWLKHKRDWLSLKKAGCTYPYMKHLLSPYCGGFVLLPNQSEIAKYKANSDDEEYYSQMMQDYFLDRYIFRKKEHGFFLDIGGNDPVSINNTYFFERSRGWKGLAFEPMKTLADRWRDVRKTECLPYALDSTNGEMDFQEYEAHAMSGFTDEVDFDGTIKSSYIVPVRRLADVLEERGIRHVDFVSLDVEGAETRVLRGIDFSRVSIDCFTIENNKGPSHEKSVRDFMDAQGYRLVARLWIDEVYVKN